MAENVPKQRFPWVRDVILLFVGILLDRTVNYTFPSLVPVLPYAWLILLVWLTREIVSKTALRRLVVRSYSRCKGWMRPVAYLIVFIVVGALGCLYLYALNKALTPNANAETNSGYKLSGRILAAGVLGVRELPRNNDTGVFLAATVTNLGLPTTVRGWLLIVRIPGKQPIQIGNSLFLPPGQLMNFETPPGAPPMAYSTDDALYNKGVGKPLITGEDITGVLLFHLDNVAIDDAYKKGTSLELRFTDANQNVYSAFYEFSGTARKGQPENLYFPGMKALPSPEPSPAISAKDKERDGRRRELSKDLSYRKREQEREKRRLQLRRDLDYRKPL